MNMRNLSFYFQEYIFKDNIKKMERIKKPPGHIYSDPMR